MNINVNTKFDIGDKVFCIKRERVQETRKCPLCDGEKKVEIVTSEGNKIMECPRCEGSGEIPTSEMIHVYQLMGVDYTYNATVDAVHVHSNKVETSVVYSITYGPADKINNRIFMSTSVDEDECFATMEEAKKEIEKRNGK